MITLLAWSVAWAMLVCGVVGVASSVCHDGVIAPAWPTWARVSIIAAGVLMIALFYAFVIVYGPYRRLV